MPLGPWSAPLERRELLGRVDPRRGVLGGEHANGHAALDRPELLQALLALEPPRRPRGELEQEVAPEAVHPDVAQHNTRAALARRTLTGKVEGDAVRVHPHLDHLR